MLLDNFIANMHGPMFLLLYFTWVVTIISITRYKINNIEKNDLSTLISGSTSEKEVATLYRGKEGLHDFLLFNLLAHNILVVSKNLFHKHLIQNTAQFKLYEAKLTPVEYELYEHFKTPQDIKSSLPIVDHLYQQMENKFLNQGLIKSASYRKKLKSLQIQATSILLSLGVYKLTVALVKGHTNILFLIIMMIIAVVIQTMYFSLQTGQKRGADPAYRLTGYAKTRLSSIAVNIRQLSNKRIQRIAQQQDFNQLFLLMIFAGGSNLPHLFSHIDTLFPTYMNNAILNRSLSIIGVNEAKGISTTSGCSSGSSSSDSSGCSSGCGGCSA